MDSSKEDLDATAALTSELIASTESGLRFSFARQGNEICIVTIGSEGREEAFERAKRDLRSLPSLSRSRIQFTQMAHVDQPFHLLGCENQDAQGSPAELRPGSGIVRAFDGRPRGPAGTLTCFLKLKDKAEDRTYILGASHVLTNYWDLDPRDVDPRGALYRNPKGFPSTNDRRFIGPLVRYSTAPPYAPYGLATVVPASAPGKVVPVERDDLDAAIVEVKADFRCKQKTTCYGHFGDDFTTELNELPRKLWREDNRECDVEKEGAYLVTKCGAEEPHGGTAAVLCKGQAVPIYGPRSREPYRFKNQVLLTTQVASLQGLAFASLGDSGTMVVSKATSTPVGMLIAGSVLSGIYVMTPIATLRSFWDEGGFVLA